MSGTWELLVYREVAYFRVVMSCNVVLQSMSVLKVALHFLFFSTICIWLCVWHSV